MGALQTVAMGLVLVFLDVSPSGWDWVPDPLGWVLVLLGLNPLKELLPTHAGATVTAWVCLVVDAVIWPPGSVATIDDSIGWLFSLPTIAFCFLLSDAVGDVTEDTTQAFFRWLRNLYAVVAVLPLLVFGAGWDALTTPAAVVAVGVNVVLVLALWSAGSEDEDEEDDALARIRRRTAGNG